MDEAWLRGELGEWVPDGHLYAWEHEDEVFRGLMIGPAAIIAFELGFDVRYAHGLNRSHRTVKSWRIPNDAVQSVQEVVTERVDGSGTYLAGFELTVLLDRDFAWFGSTISLPVGKEYTSSERPERVRQIAAALPRWV